ncbi:MAG: biotin--[acetyl-CoA-carboxylase] ligase [Phycisphaerales bacterium]|nr:biotin--[acetyl-CoA-carboxylase] ligase [Phycisphaerales bacterium]
MSPHRPFQAPDLASPEHRRLIGGVLCFKEIESTNAYLLRHAPELPDGVIAVTELQTAGRGRLGRRWTAPRGAGVLVSVLVREPVLTPLRSLGAAVGAVAAVESIRSVTDCDAAIRWPNDVTINGRKVAGVLAEVASPPGNGLAVVIGVGINCLQQRGHFEGDLREKATSLEIESSRPVDRHAVARALVSAMDKWLADAPHRGFAERLNANWRGACRDAGSHVTLRQGEALFAGVVQEIDADAALVVRLDDGGERRFEPETTTRAW